MRTAAAAKEKAAASAAEVRERALLQSVIPGRVIKPPRVVIYGVHGIGKSSFAADAPSPIFIPTEEGANELAVAKFPTATTHEEVLGYLRALYVEDHDYKTVAIDSVDWLEDYIRLELQREFTDKELAYGRESLMAEERLGEVLSALNALRNKRMMTCILIAHSEIKRFDSPLTESYDRYQPKLQTRFSALLQEWADAVLFTGYDVVVKKEDAGFNRESRRGVGQGERKLFTEERPGFLAKNRYAMPDSLPLLDPLEGNHPFAEFAQWVPYLRQEMKLAEPQRSSE